MRAQRDHTALLPLPPRPYRVVEHHLRPDGKDCLVSFDASLYSVPAWQVRARQQVDVQVSGDEAAIHHQHNSGQALLARRVSQVIAERSDPDERQMLHRYAVWHVIRRLRSRPNGADTTRSQADAAQRHIRAAIVLLDWLAAHDHTLATAGQGDLDAWLTSAQATHRIDAGNFVHWARKHTLTRLDFPPVKWGGPTGVIDTETC